MLTVLGRFRIVTLIAAVLLVDYLMFIHYGIDFQVFPQSLHADAWALPHIR
jgi:hypothetical protein